MTIPSEAGRGFVSMLVPVTHRRLSLAILVAALLSTGVCAQGGIVGLGSGALLNVDLDSPPNFSFSVQLGAEVRPNVSVRLLAEIYPFEAGAAAYRVALDALYTSELATDTVGYFGGGLGLLGSPIEGLFPEIHVTGGVEYLVSEELGVFGEVQLIIIVPLIRVGANYHF